MFLCLIVDGGEEISFWVEGDLVHTKEKGRKFIKENQFIHGFYIEDRDGKVVYEN